MDFCGHVENVCTENDVWMLPRKLNDYEKTPGELSSPGVCFFIGNMGYRSILLRTNFNGLAVLSVISLAVNCLVTANLDIVFLLLCQFLNRNLRGRSGLS